MEVDAGVGRGILVVLINSRSELRAVVATIRFTRDVERVVLVLGIEFEEANEELFDERDDHVNRFFFVLFCLV